MIKLNPYLHFKDNCKEAMEFYNSVFGGKLTLATFKENRVPVPAEMENNIMHSQLETDNGITIMAADTPPHVTPNPGATISMSLSGEDESVLTEYWNKLAEGATVAQKLEKAPWGDTFGMLTDKFGIEWFVNITTKK